MPRVHSLYSRALGLDSISILGLALNAGMEGLSICRCQQSHSPPPTTGDNQACLQMMTNVLQEEEATWPPLEITAPQGLR